MLEVLGYSIVGVTNQILVQGEYLTLAIPVRFDAANRLSVKAEFRTIKRPLRKAV
jgi:hypothetical protein